MEYVSLEEFNTKCIYQKGEDYFIASYAVLNQWKTRNIIHGIVLEACVHIFDYYLVFMTYDCSYEEALTVSLLDKDGVLLEEEDIFSATYY